MLQDENLGEALEYGAELGAGDHGDVVTTVDSSDAARHRVRALRLGRRVSLRARLDIIVEPDQESAEEP
jgi:hypothetical protein